MHQGVKPTREKLNGIHDFTVIFWKDKVIIGNETVPLGLITTEILEYPPEKIAVLRKPLSELFLLVTEQLFVPDVKKDLVLVTTVQDKMNEAFDIIIELPLFDKLELEKRYSRSLLQDTYTRFPEQFQKIITPGNHENISFTEYITSMVTIPDEILSFQCYIGALLDEYLDHAKIRNSESYAVGVYHFFSNVELQNLIASALPPTPFQYYKQTCHAVLEFAPMPNPDNIKEYVLAERMVFYHLGDFLHVEFFRGLIHGHAPRRCKNCGKYFLLTEGYNTLYCNRIAPGETEKTCRNIGAYKTATKGEQKSPERKLYDKVYNRLKTRHQRKKISTDEWNKAVALALEYKEKAERGEIEYYQLKEIYNTEFK